MTKITKQNKKEKMEKIDKKTTNEWDDTNISYGLP